MSCPPPCQAVAETSFPLNVWWSDLRVNLLDWPENRSSTFNRMIISNDCFSNAIADVFPCCCYVNYRNVCFYSVQLNSKSVICPWGTIAGTQGSFGSELQEWGWCCVVVDTLPRKQLPQLFSFLPPLLPSFFFSFCSSSSAAFSLFSRYLSCCPDVCLISPFKCFTLT